jgi:hypothetical protein
LYSMPKSVGKKTWQRNPSCEIFRNTFIKICEQTCREKHFRFEL